MTGKPRDAPPWSQLGNLFEEILGIALEAKHCQWTFSGEMEREFRLRHTACCTSIAAYYLLLHLPRIRAWLSILWTCSFLLTNSFFFLKKILFFWKSFSFPFRIVLRGHAHHFMGFDRLATEIVPRCRPLRDQLKSLRNEEDENGGSKGAVWQWKVRKSFCNVQKWKIFIETALGLSHGLLVGRIADPMLERKGFVNVYHVYRQSEEFRRSDSRQTLQSLCLQHGKKQVDSEELLDSEASLACFAFATGFVKMFSKCSKHSKVFVLPCLAECYWHFLVFPLQVERFLRSRLVVCRLTESGRLNSFLIKERNLRENCVWKKMREDLWFPWIPRMWWHQISSRNMIPNQSPRSPRSQTWKLFIGFHCINMK